VEDRERTGNLKEEGKRMVEEVCKVRKVKGGRMFRRIVLSVDFKQAFGSQEIHLRPQKLHKVPKLSKGLDSWQGFKRERGSEPLSQEL
jgi:hypothetical protein